MLGKLVQTDFWPEKDYRPNFQNWVNLLRILRKLRNCDISLLQNNFLGQGKLKINGKVYKLLIKQIIEGLMDRGVWMPFTKIGDKWTPPPN